MSLIIRTFSIVALSVFFAATGHAQTQLLMFSTEGCAWCQQWKAEVGVIYAKTDEGKIAPLTELDAYGAIPDTYTLKSNPRYTPTFVLIKDGREVGRIEGYPGEEFFWGMLDAMLEKLAHGANAQT